MPQRAFLIAFESPERAGSWPSRGKRGTSLLKATQSYPIHKDERAKDPPHTLLLQGWPGATEQRVQ